MSGDVVRRRGNMLYEVAPSRPGSGADQPSTGPTYRSNYAQNGFPTLEGVNSLYDVFQKSVRECATKECLGHRVDKKYVWQTYEDVANKVSLVASAMAHVGVPAHGRAGIYAVNCPEWMITMQACNRMSVYTIPLYDTLGEEAVEYCINHSESSMIFVSTANWAKLQAALPRLPNVHTLVYIGAEVKPTDLAGKKLFSWEEFLELGKANPANARPPAATDLCTIMYTSGTSGTPKGVLLTHSMVMASVKGMLATTEQLPIDPIGPNDVYLSYLPLAHVLDRVFEEMILAVGGKIGYFSGDVKFLSDDLAALKPTIFVGVPRVFDRIYAGVNGQVKKSGGMKKWLFEFGFNRKLKAMKGGSSYKTASPFFDRLVFSKIKARLGGNVRIALSGAAPLSPHVEDFLRVVMCCYFACGYGLTESCAASFFGMSQDQEYTIGIACPSCEYRLESIPELKYDAQAEPPRGEICLRGPTICQGYYKEEEKTKEAMDQDGFFHTGDVGEILPNGALKIIDRKKQIFKLSQGEYVAVEKVESVYSRLDLIAQIWVYGNSMESNLVAVVVPEEAVFLSAAQKSGLAGSFKEVLAKPEAKELILAEMNKVGKQAKLKGFEMVRAVILEQQQFSVDNDLLTPTFKLKRPLLQKHYQSAIDNAYQTLSSK